MPASSVGAYIQATQELMNNIYAEFARRIENEMLGNWIVKVKMHSYPCDSEDVEDPGLP